MSVFVRSWEHDQVSTYGRCPLAEVNNSTVLFDKLITQLKKYSSTFIEHFTARIRNYIYRRLSVEYGRQY